jgi:hypothetical protein
LVSLALHSTSLDWQDVNLTAAIVRLPDREREIRRLAGRDESFRSLCEDLTDAAQALDHWLTATSAHVPDRISEYRSLIVALVTEMQASLDAAAGQMDEPSRRVSFARIAD